MNNKTKNNKEMTLLLLQESLWKIEDKLRIFVESLADHEADIIRLRRMNSEILQRLDDLERPIKESKRRIKNG